VVFELPLLLLQGRCSVRGWQDVSLDEIVTVRTGIEAFPKVVGCALAFELESFGLEGAVTWSAEGTCGMEQGAQMPDWEWGSLRSCSGIKQDVSVLQVLSFRALLQVLLQAVAPLIAAHGRDGGSIDGVSVNRIHGGGGQRIQ
jgi:hypothetical protein